VPPDEFVLGLIQETMVGRKLELIGEKLDRLIELSKPEPAGWPVVLPRFREISTTSYQTVVEWKVGNVWNKERGRLEEISMVSDDYDHTRFRLTVAKNVMFTDLRNQSALTLPFRRKHVLERGTDVLLEARSTDGTAVKVNGLISGVEW
ncbi:MAG: hypothetical protein JRD89_15895, partial [Deltaproteobacteria bacterium]|nr:hypothetical protein [Deltaproteobacteria bacterium]